MRSRIASLFSATIALACSVQVAKAGAVRYVGKELHKGSIAAVQKTSDAAGTAAGGFQGAGKAAGATLKNGTATLKKDAASGPSMAVRGTKAAASRVWKAVW
jgi:hypothetical protein